MQKVVAMTSNQVESSANPPDEDHNECDRLEREYNRLSISIHDFEAATSYLGLFDETSSYVLQDAIASAAVVAYARPFKGSNAGIEQLSARKLTFDLAEIFDAKQLHMHDTIIALRDRGIAHSDYDLKPTRRIQGPKGGGTMSEGKTFNPQEGLNIAMFRDLAHRLHVHCVTLKIEISQRLDEYFLKKQTG
jgi:hypothetical protein